MKWMTSWFLFTLSTLMLSQMTTLKVQAQSTPTPDVIFQQQVNVPGPDQQETGKAGQGVNMSFSVNQKSTVFLNITTNASKPTLNVYVLYSDNYAQYKATGSLAKATPLKDFTKLDTGSFKATGVLNTGSYGIVIQWSKVDLYDTMPNVIVEVDAEKYVPPTPTPTAVAKP
ncbi:MAG TPA: hypothetical protein VN963_09230 [bacterium]|nr:hypothetical protein [bacterium]